jgi:hypothetical protein
MVVPEFCRIAWVFLPAFPAAEDAISNTENPVQIADAPTTWLASNPSLKAGRLFLHLLSVGAIRYECSSKTVEWSSI